MNILFVLLQQDLLPAEQVMEESYFNLLLKGGWILVPIFFLLFLSIFVMIERWVFLNQSQGKDKTWLVRVGELVKEGKIEKAMSSMATVNNASSRVIRAGLDELEQEGTDVTVEDTEQAMQIESRQEIGRLEKRMSYLSISAAIAPMLGFLGTIFGVIKIFYNISVTNDLNIASISDGLYQKMICSGAGLFVGLVAYTGYYLLNAKIDNVVNQVDKDSNEVLKSVKQYKKKEAEQ